MESTDFKAFMFEHLASIAHAFSAPKRLEIIDVLAQGERDVDSLSKATSMTVANTSRHLQILKQMRLVESRREGVRRFYKLTDEEVIHCMTALRTLAEKRSTEMREIAQQYYQERDAMDSVTKEELLERMDQEDVIVLDVRPYEEYIQGHIKGSLSVPFSELSDRLSELPKNSSIVAYCRGPYCVWSMETLSLLKRHGLKGLRLKEGLPEWRVAGYPIEKGEYI